MTDSVVVEGQVKLRDGKKWKSRWVALRKPSPVADCLLLLVYKDKADKTKGHKERSSMTLEDICGLDPGLSYEGMSHTMAIICLTQAVMLGFENKEAMYTWDIRIRYSLGEVHRFHVAVLPGTKLESGPATLHLCNDLLILVRDVPPTIIGQWKLSDLRRYGAVPNGFVFEGGTRCGYWAGVFFLACAEGEQISFLFDCIVRGISPTKGPFGLRPVLPDLNANPADIEDRVSYETLELEKRLSLLSRSNRQSSTASTSSYGASVALGDDRSLSSSSSDTSHSDTSIGSRLAMWPEPSLGGASMESHELAAVKSMHPGEEKMYAEVMRGCRPPPKPPRPRKPHQIVRQSSSDSGIATGSHSSYSGSFSSYAGSLDICHADELGSLLSLPLNFASDQNLCTCQHGEHPRAVGSEYQIPSSLRHLYDTPRSLLQAATAREAQGKSSVSTLLTDQGTSTLLPSVTDTNLVVPEQRPDRGLAAALSDYGSSRDLDETYVDYVPRWSVAKQQGEVLECKSSELAPSADVSTDPCEICSPHPGVTRALFTACPVCGGLKGTTLSHSGVLTIPAVPDKKPNRKDEKRKTDLTYEIMEGRGAEKSEESDEKSELMASCGHRKIFHETEEGSAGTLRTHREHTSLADPRGTYELMASAVESPKRCDFGLLGEYGGVFAYPVDLPVPDRPRGDGVTYVNIPVSPASRKQLHYMELERQEPGSGARGGGSTKYAQIDITATETAHKVGTQHAQGREERLQELEQKKRGALQ
ncbi:protein Dok-7-like isoform X2 [Polyodon spathula]|uniref:protein Dok-7-like isoform X2 n=1 Tax=Polyodon spathula TaxID=7913 RepID=UPI001B7DE221|nr:protein Dok-7-like isoform X2 [Polyodon spathula]